MKNLERILERIKGVNSLRVLVSLSLMAQLAILFFIFTQNRMFYLKDLPQFDNKASLKRSCHLAMASILNKRASSVIFEKSLISQMQEDDYRFFDFVGGEKIFDVAENQSKGQCTVIITDRLGDRLFSLRFKDSDKSAHIYGRYVQRIDEITYDKLTEGHE